MRDGLVATFLSPFRVGISADFAKENYPLIVHIVDGKHERHGKSQKRVSKQSLQNGNENIFAV